MLRTPLTRWGAGTAAEEATGMGEILCAYVFRGFSAWFARRSARRRQRRLSATSQQLLHRIVIALLAGAISLVVPQSDLCLPPLEFSRASIHLGRTRTVALFLSTASSMIGPVLCYVIPTPFVHERQPYVSLSGVACRLCFMWGSIWGSGVWDTLYGRRSPSPVRCGHVPVPSVSAAAPPSC